MQSAQLCLRLRGSGSVCEAPECTKIEIAPGIEDIAATV